MVPFTGAGSVFHVYKKLLAFRLIYFKELLEGESPPEVYVLGTYGLTCEWFVEWVYTNSVSEGTNKHNTALVEFFLLAQRLRKDPRLGNLIMNRIRKRCRQGVTESLLQEVIKKCYEKLEAKSPLRRWLVKYVAWNLFNMEHDAGKYQSLIEGGGPFAMDLILTLMSVASGPFADPLEEPDCKYHKHAESVECDARSF